MPAARPDRDRVSAGGAAPRDRNPELIARVRGIVLAMSVMPLIERWLHSGFWWQRARALRGLGLLQMTTHTAAIVAALDDPDVEVRAAALDAIADLRDPASLQALVVRLHDQSLPRGRRAAAIAAFGCQLRAVPAGDGGGRRGEPRQLRTGAGDLRDQAFAACVVPMDTGPAPGGARRGLDDARTCRARRTRGAAGDRGVGERRRHGAGRGGLRAAEVEGSRKTPPRTWHSISTMRGRSRPWPRNRCRRWETRGSSRCRRRLRARTWRRCWRGRRCGRCRPLVDHRRCHRVRRLSLAATLYLVVWNALQFAMGAVAGWFIRHYVLRRTRRDRLLPDRLTRVPHVSVIVPAYNEALTIVESVRALLALDYEAREIVVVNDGSSDDTLAVLLETFHMVAAPFAFVQPLASEPVRGVYRSIREPALVVIDKQNGGCKSDALNAGINVASGELVLTIDADTVLEPDALSRAVLPFLEDPTTIAVGGNVAIANGCRIEHGRITDVALPRSWLARFQIIEYMRSFLLFRVAWVSTNAVTLISGAFGLFRREAVIAVAGYDRTAIGEDMDLTLRLQRFYRAARPAVPNRLRSLSALLDAGARGLGVAAIAAVSVAPRPAPVALAASAHDRQSAIRRCRPVRAAAPDGLRGFRAAPRDQRLRHRDAGGGARHSRLATLRCARRRGAAVRHRGHADGPAPERSLDAALLCAAATSCCWLPPPSSKTAAIASSMPGGDVWGRCRR